MDKLRIGVIGLGRISALHLPAYTKKYGIAAELVAVSDTNNKKMTEVATSFNLDYTYKDYRELLRNHDIDAVEILTPHDRHLQMTIDAAKAGKHISLQKIPALSITDMDMMIQEAKREDVWFRVFENFRFYEPYQRAMEIINSGKIGKVERVDYNMVSTMNAMKSWDVPLSSWTWRISEKKNYASPTIIDDGFHKHSMMAQFLDNDIDSVIGWMGNNKYMGVVKLDTPAVMIYQNKKQNRYGVWNSSFHDTIPLKSKYYGSDEWVQITGSNGAIWIPGCTGSWFEEQAVQGPTKAGVHWIGQGDEEWHSETDLDTDWASSFINCSREFVDAIKDNRQPQLDPKTARFVLQIGFALLRSMRNNSKKIRIKDINDKP